MGNKVSVVVGSVKPGKIFTNRISDVTRCPFRDKLRDNCYNGHKGNSTYVSLAVIFPLIEAWITTSNSCLHRKSKRD